MLRINFDLLSSRSRASSSAQTGTRWVLVAVVTHETKIVPGVQQFGFRTCADGTCEYGHRRYDFLVQFQ